jgi:formiminotetrahydrofolate cyclodeaminase
LRRRSWKWRRRSPGEPGAQARAARLRARALELAEQDLHAYEPVLEASRLPEGDPAREQRLAAALSAASDSPLEIARAAAEVAGLAGAIADEGRASLKGDALAGAELARAACAAAARLVEINLDSQPDDPRLAQAREYVSRSGSRP